MRHARTRKASKVATKIRTATVGALALGSLLLAAESQVHAATPVSHSAPDADTVHAEKAKAKAVAEARGHAGSRGSSSGALARAQKAKAKAVAEARGHAGSRGSSSGALARAEKAKAKAVAEARGHAGSRGSSSGALARAEKAKAAAVARAHR